MDNRISELLVNPPARHSHKGLKLAGIAVLVVAIAVAALGIRQREAQEKKIAAWTYAQAVPTVAIIRPKPESKAQPLKLPGNIDAWYEAPIYARVAGYLKVWYTDIGADVKAGQVLGVISTPTLDEELDRAKHELASRIADWKLAKVTAARWSALLGSGSVSQESVDQKQAESVALNSKVAAAQANVDRLNALAEFKQLTAPFDGMVTARKTDIGALINVGSGVGPELFAVADIHKMRVYVRVPQNFSAEIHVGMRAILSLPQFPDRTFPAKVTTLSKAINPESNTVLVELEADNPDRQLWPGTFATVAFDLAPDPNVLEIPASALLFQAEGLQVAVLGPDNKVTIRSVRVGRNFGTMVEILSGLKPADHVIDSPPDSIEAGEVVRPQAENPAITRDTAETQAHPRTAHPDGNQPAEAE
jgi:membrane fusion protein, multidrug efflux system